MGPKERSELGPVAFVQGCNADADTGVQLVDHDTSAPPPPCFITSLVGGKRTGTGLVVTAAVTRVEAGAGVPATMAVVTADLLELSSTAAGSVLKELSSTAAGLTTLSATLFTIHELATNSSVKKWQDW